jgi:hypothetical protein
MIPRVIEQQRVVIHIFHAFLFIEVMHVNNFGVFTTKRLSTNKIVAS